MLENQCSIAALLLAAVLATAPAFASGTAPDRVREKLSGERILFVERNQYPQDHHNTATMFMRGEINEDSFTPGAALRIFDVDSGGFTTLVETGTGLIRDPELSWDARKVVFSMRPEFNDGYHIYEINVDGTGLRQLTWGADIADIDPAYLPDGKIVFSSSRQPKYCMCNKHIMYNLYTMEADGSHISQIGISTLAEGHSSILSDGRILYDRWEYVDRNFADAQGLWTVNPDGTKHSVYYGNNTNSPAGSIDGRQVPDTDLVVCIFGACHSRPWGAVAMLDRKKGVDGEAPVVHIWPKESRRFIDNGNYDSFRTVERLYEDPYPLDRDNLLVSRTIWLERDGDVVSGCKMGIYLICTDDTEELVLESGLSAFDPQLVRPRPVPPVIPTMRDYSSKEGTFFVENVYWGTDMDGVEPGSVKYLRVVESPEKRTWVPYAWSAQGTEWPGMNWHSFENKRILGEVEVEADGSASFKVPAGKFVYFQLLDKDKKMIQSMRSGTSLMPGERNGCIGCHEDRLSVPEVTSRRPAALRGKPKPLRKWMDKEPFLFSFMEHVQPILDKHCVQCHDFDPADRDKLVLASDRNPFFNAAYVNIYVKKEVQLVGGGPAEIQKPYSWGSHPSRLTACLEESHHGVRLSADEKETMCTWMDLNGVYYPVYETSFGENPAGRSPLTFDETDELADLTGLDFGQMGDFNRPQTAQISFDRPELSPCLDLVKDRPEAYARVLELIRLGGERLKATPRGDIESQLVVCERQARQLEVYKGRVPDTGLFVDDRTACGPLRISGMTLLDGKLFTSEKGGSRVASYSLDDGGFLDSWALSAAPTGLATDGSFIYATVGGIKPGVEVVAPSRLGQRSFIRAGAGACAPLVNGSRLYVCNRFAGTVSEMDLPGGKVTREVKVVREPVACVLSPDGKYLFVNNFLPDGTANGEVRGACVSVIGTDSFALVANIELPSGSNALRGLAVSPDGKSLLVAHNIARYQLPTTQLLQGWMNTSALSIIDIASLSYKGSVLLDEPERGAAGVWDVACVADKVVVSHSGTHELSIIRWSELNARMASCHDVTALSSDLRLLEGCRSRVKVEGNGPRKMLADSGRIFVDTYFSDTLNIVSPDSGRILSALALAPCRKETAAERGERYFNDATLCFQGWQSCNACHPGDARADALNWDNLNDGIGNAKQTKSLLYAVQTPPSMISGIRADAQSAVRAGFKHIQFHEVDEEIASCVDAYLTSLKPEPSPFLVDGKLSDKAERGRKVYQQYGCADCHNGPYYTDGKTYRIGADVEFEKGWDTPTLCESWRTAPYLFDGRAATMEEVFTVHKHGLEGKKISQKKIDELVEFVNSL